MKINMNTLDPEWLRNMNSGDAVIYDRDLYLVGNLSNEVFGAYWHQDLIPMIHLLSGRVIMRCGGTAVRRVDCEVVERSLEGPD